MMRTFLVIDIGAATLALATSYALQERWTWVAAILVVGLLWMTEPRHGARWIVTAGLIFFIFVAIVGALLGLAAFWLFSSLVALLVAWDVNQLDYDLSAVQDVRGETELKRIHFRRLGTVAILGWVFGVAALNFRVTFDFILTLGLGLAIIVTLSRAIRFMQSEGEEE
jgi:hypothetical protein